MWLSIGAGDDGAVELRGAEPYDARAVAHGEKVADILAVLGPEPRSAADIAEDAGVSRATAYRILGELKAAGDAAKVGSGWVCHVSSPLGGVRHETDTNGVGTEAEHDALKGGLTAPDWREQFIRDHRDGAA